MIATFNDPKWVILYNRGIQRVITEVTHTVIFLVLKGKYMGQIISITQEINQ